MAGGSSTNSVDKQTALKAGAVVQGVETVPVGWRYSLWLSGNDGIASSRTPLQSHTHFSDTLTLSRSQERLHTLPHAPTHAHKLSRTLLQTLTCPPSLSLSNTRVRIWVHTPLTLLLLVCEVQRSNLGRRSVLLGFLAVIVSLSRYMIWYDTI